MNVPPEITQKILNEQSNGNRIQNIEYRRQNKEVIWFAVVNSSLANLGASFSQKYCKYYLHFRNDLTRTKQYVDRCESLLQNMQSRTLFSTNPTAERQYLKICIEMCTYAKDKIEKGCPSFPVQRFSLLTAGITAPVDNVTTDGWRSYEC
jgi:hypothetical protein